jgi:quinol monooxygenase YgiN
MLLKCPNDAGRTTRFAQPRRRDYVNKVGILATLQAPPGKESAVQQFLLLDRPLVEAETMTTWFAFKIAPATLGIFDTFRDEDGTSAHVNGEVEKALFARAEELFVSQPYIKTVDILAEKLQPRGPFHNCSAD